MWAILVCISIKFQYEYLKWQSSKDTKLLLRMSDIIVDSVYMAKQSISSDVRIILTFINREK